MIKSNYGFFKYKLFSTLEQKHFTELLYPKLKKLINFIKGLNRIRIKKDVLVIKKC